MFKEYVRLDQHYSHITTSISGILASRIVMVYSLPSCSSSVLNPVVATTSSQLCSQHMTVAPDNLLAVRSSRGSKMYSHSLVNKRYTSSSMPWMSVQIHLEPQPHENRSLAFWNSSWT